MIRIIERIRCSVSVSWEAGGVCPPMDTEGYTLEDGSLVVKVYDHWEGDKVECEPVLDAGEIIGFNPTERADISHIGEPIRLSR